MSTLKPGWADAGGQELARRERSGELVIKPNEAPPGKQAAEQSAIYMAYVNSKRFVFRNWGRSQAEIAASNRRGAEAAKKTKRLKAQGG